MCSPRSVLKAIWQCRITIAPKKNVDDLPLCRTLDGACYSPAPRGVEASSPWPCALLRHHDLEIVVRMNSFGNG